MRDFEADVLQAALTGHPLPASEFSWSPARHRLFTFCKRAYFLRHYLAQGGWNEHACETVRSAYLEKHLPGFDQWLSAAFEKSLIRSLRSLADRNSNRRKEDFEFEMNRNLNRETGALLYGLDSRQYLDDPKLPGLREHFRSEPEFRDLPLLHNRIDKIFRKSLDTFLTLELAEELVNLPYMALRTNVKFLQLPRDSFTVWMRGGMIWFYQNHASILRFAGRSNGISPLELEYHRMNSALFRVFVNLRNENLQSAFHVFTITENEPELHLVPHDLDLNDLLVQSCRDMLNMIHADGTVTLDEFEPAEDKARCQFCIFRKTCKMLKLS